MTFFLTEFWRKKSFTVSQNQRLLKMPQSLQALLEGGEIEAVVRRLVEEEVKEIISIQTLSEGVIDLMIVSITRRVFEGVDDSIEDIISTVIQKALTQTKECLICLTDQFEFTDPCSQCLKPVCVSCSDGIQSQCERNNQNYRCPFCRKEMIPVIVIQDDDEEEDRDVYEVIIIEDDDEPSFASFRRVPEFPDIFSPRLPAPRPRRFHSESPDFNPFSFVLR